jgi:Squalene-hopene cyclase C-terminal domain
MLPADMTARRGVPFLMASQNSDGGWGYQAGGSTRIEATAWAVLALISETPSPSITSALQRGFTLLRKTQLRNGSWPPFPGHAKGCWATSLACLALHAGGEASDRVSKGTAWVINSWPAEHRLACRLKNRFLTRRQITKQNPELVGWSWTPGTASWVEPTAYALILLRALRASSLPRGANRRVRLAERMLYDRMCPGGGWNTGNPLVYGVGGIPRVGPTVWALLALPHHAARTENQQSLCWLERTYAAIQGRASLALAHLGLRCYGRKVGPLETGMRPFDGDSGAGGSLLANAFEAISAATTIPPWLGVGTIRTNGGL